MKKSTGTKKVAEDHDFFIGYICAFHFVTFPKSDISNSCEAYWYSQVIEVQKYFQNYYAAKATLTTVKDLLCPNFKKKQSRAAEWHAFNLCWKKGVLYMKIVHVHQTEI